MAEEPETTVQLRLRVGQEVSARWTNGAFYGATVLELDGDRVLAKWNDGHEPTWITRADVKLDPPPVEAHQLRPGMMVSAQWTDGGWYQATIEAVEDGRFFVKWIDGGEPSCVRAEHLRLAGPAAMDPAILMPGMKVYAAWTDGKMYPAKIVSVSDGRVEVEFESAERKRLWLLPVQVTPRA